VSDDGPTRPPPRARPVTDLPGDALVADAEGIARRWALALIGARPLASIGEIPFEDLAREAPSLCAQAVRALQSDAELERLTGAGGAGARAAGAPARQLDVIAGAADTAAAVLAVEALRGALWEALLAHLHEPTARQVGDVADRLAYICTASLAAAVETAFAPAGGDVVEDASRAAGARHGRDADPDAAPGVAEPGVRERDAVAAERPTAVIVDESAPVPVRAPSPEIEIRDVREGRVQRGEAGPAAWIGSIGAQLERFERDGLPFAVLLVEPVDIERLRRDFAPEELAALSGRMEAALVAGLGSPSGPLTRERPGRCWLVMAQTDHERARELSERLARTVVSDPSDRGPLELAIGVAVCPHDGHEAAALAAHADVGLYAARAALRVSAGERAASRGGA
jgi:hypothetical protein